MAHSPEKADPAVPDASPTMCIVQWPLLSDLAEAIYNGFMAEDPQFQDNPTKPVWGLATVQDRDLMIGVAKYLWDNFPGGVRVIEEPLRRTERFYHAFACDPEPYKITRKTKATLHEQYIEHGSAVRLIQVDVSSTYMNESGQDEVRVGLILERTVNA